MKNTIFTIVFCILFSNVWADVIVTPDDSVVLADPWVDTEAKQPNGMPPLRALNPRILQMVRSYAEVTEEMFKSLSPKRESDILKELLKLTTRTSELKFYFVKNVDELNEYCASGGKKTYELPEGAIVTQAACTAGKETFIIEDIFRRLNLRQQILLLIHERLTTITDSFGNKNYAAIAKVTTGLGVFFEKHKEQSIGKYSRLKNDELRKLTDFYSGIEEIELRNSDPLPDSFRWISYPYGGGRVHEYAQIDPSAIVSVGSILSSGTEVHGNAKIINSSLAGDIEVGSSSLIQSSKMSGNSKLLLGSNVEIKDSLIEANYRMEIDAGEKLKSGEIRSEFSQIYHPKGIQLHPIKLNWIIHVLLEPLNIEVDGVKVDNSPKNTEREFEKYGHAPEFTIKATASRKGFSSNYTYALQMNLNLDPKSSKDNEYMVLDGKIIKAGFKKTVDIPLKSPYQHLFFHVADYSDIFKSSVEKQLRNQNYEFKTGHFTEVEFKIKNKEGNI